LTSEDLSSLPGRLPLAGLHVGLKTWFRRTLTEGDVAMFIGATWDINPLHTDEVYASHSRFGRRIVPGLLIASLLTHLGGLWGFLATRMDFRFLAPVFIGETITAEGTVVELDEDRHWVRLQCACRNETGQAVLEGQVEGFPGKIAPRGEAGQG
jgi:3-hydroxybutyryl-CoA dehydratase